MKIKIIRKIFAVILIIINILTISKTIVYGAEISGAKIYYSHDCGRHLQYKKEDGTLSYVVTAYVQYDLQGKQYPAYCINSDKPGVGNLPGEFENYNVNIKKVIEDERIWRVIVNGYPYKTAKQLGVENDDDAYVATKHAIYSILNTRDIRNFYYAADERGENIINAIEKLVNIGIKGTQTKATTNLSIKKIGELKLDSINSNYYSQQYNVTSGVNISNYQVISTEGFPEGSIITDIKNNNKNKFTKGENFKILIPKDKITKDIKGTINIQAECETYPVFYGESEKEGYQNYAVCYDVFEKCTGNVELEKTVYGEFELTKRAAKNNIWTGTKEGEVLPGAVYEIKDNNNRVVETLTTDKDGKIYTKLKPGKYTIQEIQAPDHFEKDDTIYDFTIERHEQIVNLEVFDFPIEGGFLEIEKTSLDNNLVLQIPENSPLEGAIYEIKDELGEVVTTITTNKDGIIEEPIKLKVGLYSLQEIQAPDGYLLDNTIKYFKIENNEEVIKLNLKDNSIIVGKLEIKKTSSDTNLWTGNEKGDALQGAVYEIRNLKNNLIKTIETDKNGETQIYLEEGEYALKEVKAPEGFEIDEEEKIIKIEKNEQIITLQLENQPIKCGILNLTKKSADDNRWNNIPKGTNLQGAEYEIKDEKGEIVNKVVTNDEGTIDCVKLQEGKYTIQEVVAPECYVIDDKIYYFEITENKQNINFDFLNKSIPKQEKRLPRTGM